MTEEQEPNAHQADTARADSSVVSDVQHDGRVQEFRIPLGDETAVLQYQRSSNRINLFHTEVPPAHRKQGIAHRLARSALEFARENELRVVPSCPFVADYIRRHPEFQDLIGT
jgi:uncharacterized protein